jgi:hypothetical protein
VDHALLTAGAGVKKKIARAERLEENVLMECFIVFAR